MSTEQTPLQRYRTETGQSLKRLAARFGVDKTTMLRWETGQVPVPAERVIDVERVTGISRNELRPDLADIFVPTSPSEASAA